MSLRRRECMLHCVVGGFRRQSRRASSHLHTMLSNINGIKVHVSAQSAHQCLAVFVASPALPMVLVSRLAVAPLHVLHTLGKVCNDVFVTYYRQQSRLLQTMRYIVQVGVLLWCHPRCLTVSCLQAVLDDLQLLLSKRLGLKPLVFLGIGHLTRCLCLDGRWSFSGNHLLLGGSSPFAARFLEEGLHLEVKSLLSVLRRVRRLNRR